MTRRKQNKPLKNDFAPDENEEIIGLTSEPIAAGTCISSFSFDDDTITKNVPGSPVADNPQSFESNNPLCTTDNPTNNNKPGSSKDINNIRAFNNTLADNRKAPVVNGMAPPIDGEYLNTKRTYMLRASTVRKLNELKSIHPDLNTYVSTIVDIAIAHYYNHIVNEGGKQ